MKKDIVERVGIPAGVSVFVSEFVTVKGPRGEIKKRLFDHFVGLKVEGNEIVIEAKSATKHQKRVVYTFKAHLLNMVKGVVEPWVYKMRICAGHFPMNVSVQGNKFVVKNFLGEKVPRVLEIKKDVKVAVQDKDVVVESVDKEFAGNVASDIELLLAVKGGRDLRKFQDGIYMINKAGKEISTK